MELTWEQRQAVWVIVATALGWHDLTSRGIGCLEGLHPDHFVGRFGVPDYTGDPAQIGLMLEHFRAKWLMGPIAELKWWEIHDYPSGWNVVIKNTRGGLEGSAEAVPTLELAICLAIADYQRAQAQSRPSPDSGQQEG
jgi:hypothetical protein